MAYLLLFVPAVAAAVAHWAFMPKFAARLLKEFDGLPLPQATNLAVQAAPVVYSVPVVLLCLALLVGRFRILKHPTLIGGIGAALALGLSVRDRDNTAPDHAVRHSRQSVNACAKGPGSRHR